MIHPTQYSSRTDVRLSEPHKRLMAAVLQAVVDDRRGGSVHRRSAGNGAGREARGVRKAIAYVASTDRAWPFSFENLCEALGLDADGLRDKLDVLRGPA
jgi:hypothetical protein